MSRTTSPRTVARGPGVAIAGTVAIAVAGTGLWVGYGWGYSIEPEPITIRHVHDGDDPLSGNCARDAQIAVSEAQPDGSTVELWYSFGCQANFARVRRADGRSTGNDLIAAISVADDPLRTQKNSARDVSAIYSPMLADTTETLVCASGAKTIDGSMVNLPAKACA